jgi:hypothetical protein
MTLKAVTKKYGIEITNSDGTLRNVVDVLEDIYLKLNAKEFIMLMLEIQEEEKDYNLFDDARGRKYRGVE